MESECPDAILPLAVSNDCDEGSFCVLHPNGRTPQSNQSESAAEQENTEMLVLQLRDAAYRALVKRAVKEGCSIEELIAECVQGLLDA